MGLQYPTESMKFRRRLEWWPTRWTSSTGNSTDGSSCSGMAHPWYGVTGGQQFLRGLRGREAGRDIHMHEWLRDASSSKLSLKSPWGVTFGVKNFKPYRGVNDKGVVCPRGRVGRGNMIQAGQMNMIQESAVVILPRIHSADQAHSILQKTKRRKQGSLSSLELSRSNSCRAAPSPSAVPATSGRC